MRSVRREAIVQALLIILFIGICPEARSAQEYMEPDTFSFAGWAGYGSVNVSSDNSSNGPQSALALGFRAGYAINSRFLMGLELNGWTLKSYNYNDPTQGESISNISVFMNYFPVNQLPIYLTGGAGKSSYTNNSPAVGGRDTGRSWFVGSGYEYPISKQWMLVPQIRYGQGNFTGASYRVYEMSLGMNWYLQ